MLADLLPNDAKLDLDASHADKLVFELSFHHMNENGFWDGWTDHTVVVTPSLQHAFNLRISGRNRDDIKDFLHEEFDHMLRQDVSYELYRKQFPDLAVTSKWEDKDGTASQCYQAWYSSGIRFWNDLAGAKKHAADLMEKKFFNRA